MPFSSHLLANDATGISTVHSCLLLRCRRASPSNALDKKVINLLTLILKYSTRFFKCYVEISENRCKMA